MFRLNRARAALIGGLAIAIAFSVILMSADTGPGFVVEAQTAPSPPAVTDPAAPASAPVAATPAAPPPVAAPPVVNGSMTTSLGGSDIAVSSVGGSYEVDGPARKAKKANRKNSR